MTHTLKVGAANIADTRNFEAVGTFRKSARSTGSVSKIRTQIAHISKIRTPEKERQARRRELGQPMAASLNRQGTQNFG